MIAIYITTTNKLQFVVQGNDSYILKYDSVISYNASIIKNDISIAYIEAMQKNKNWIQVKANDINTCNIKFENDGVLKIESFVNNCFADLFFKKKSWHSNQYCLQDSNKSIIATATPDFDWRKFTYNYKIEILQTQKIFREDILFAFLLVYCVNYLQGKMYAPL